MFVWIKRGFLSLAILGLLFTGAAQAQAPERIKVLIGFDRTPGAADEALVRGLGGTVKHRYHLVPGIAAEIPERAMVALLRSPRVTSVELDGIVHAIDHELANAWGVQHVGAGVVHDGGNRGSGILVAVIDTGIDYLHPELQPNYAGGYNFVNNENNFDDPMDDNGHGTHVSGTIAAADDVDDHVGVVGMAPDASLYGLKVLNASGSGYWSDIIAAVQWAVVNGMDITNNSYGSSGNPGGMVQAAFDNAYYYYGVLHVAAAGNTGNCSGKGNKVGYPARYASVIAVAATNSTNESPCFSSTGPDLELAAPGVAVNSTIPGGGYASYSGTSMASPHVAGAAALVAASDRTLTNDQIRQRLVDTAIDLGPAGHDTYFGYGLIDVAAAVAVDPGSEDNPPWGEMTAPTADDVISGADNFVAANAWAWDDLSVARVEFFVDGELIGTDSIDDGTESWSVIWDACLVFDGARIVSAIATDSDGTLGLISGPVPVTVTNDSDACGADTTPPDPDPMTWATPPNATGTTTIAMTATTAVDDSGGPVQYNFVCDNCADSGWKSSPSYTVFDLIPGETYMFRVMASDQFDNQTAWSASASATTTTDPADSATDVHVGDLDGTGQSKKNQWWATVTITVHDSNDGEVEYLRVSGTWSGGAAGGDVECLTNASGQCSVTSSSTHKKNGSISFAIDNVSEGLPYVSGDNHDPDADSNGTSITVLKP